MGRALLDLTCRATKRSFELVVTLLTSEPPAVPKPRRLAYNFNGPARPPANFLQYSLMTEKCC